MVSELDVLRDVCERLERARIDYMLTGSIAMNYYAQPRMTRDIDLVIEARPENADHLTAIFGRDYYVSREAVERALSGPGMFNVLHLDGIVKVDLVVRKRDPFRVQEFARRARVEFPGFWTWIVSKEDLILSKLLWAADSRSDLQLRDIQNLLNTGAEDAYLDQWAHRLGVKELLEECRHGRHEP